MERGLLDKCYRNVKTNETIYENILKNKEMIDSIPQIICRCLKNGGNVFVCGNGGSSCDAMHFVAEMVGRFKMQRKPYSFVALNTDVAVITAISNDFGYDFIFEKQLEAYMKRNDILIAISTSGNSLNVIRAINKTRELEGKSIALLGKKGGLMAKKADFPIIFEHEDTARVQECHTLFLHVLSELIEKRMEG